MPVFQIEKNLKDIQGPALALILERIKLNGASQGLFFCYSALFYCSPHFSFTFCLMVFLSLISFESARAVSMGPTSKSSSKVPKSASNGVSKHGNRAISSVSFPCLSFNIFRM